MSPSPRAELVALQRTLFRRNQRRIAESVVVQEPLFAAYERRYRRAVATFSRVVSHEVMLGAVARADIIYVGDYHTCAQSQRSFLRLLKAVVTGRRPLVIGLELLHRRHQAHIDAFLAGDISEDKFLRAVGLQQHWIFDLWPNFRALFDFARYHHLPIVGIDAAGTSANLRVRDAATGKYLVQVTTQFPDHQLFVLIGDLHLAPEHLPFETLRALREKKITRRDLILYQNSEALYWQLALQGREHRVEVVQQNERSFCRMHTPPVVCQQSYLNWLEHDGGEIDFADAKQQFLELQDHVARFLRVQPPAARDDITVYTCGDLSFLQVLRRQRAFTARELATIRRHVMSAESYFIPQARLVYLANLSLNHAAEEATHYLKFLLTGPEFPRPLIDAFFANVLHEALGFFGSKLINHKRKCLHVADFRRLLAYFRKEGVEPARTLEAETTQIVLAFAGKAAVGRMSTNENFYRLPPPLFFAVTHALGYMLGDQMFYAVMAKQLPRRTVRDMMHDAWRDDGRPLQVYREVSERVAQIRMPKRV